jgi:hypothetical protein
LRDDMNSRISDPCSDDGEEANLEPAEEDPKTV